MLCVLRCFAGSREEVKGDKFRENYLGASVHANIGRWQKGRDVFWYTRDKSTDQSSLDDEVAAVKAREEDMMLEVPLPLPSVICFVWLSRGCRSASFPQALGMKPKVRKKTEMKARLDASEMKALLRRGGPEAEDGEGGGGQAAAVAQDEDAVRGLGFAS